MVALRGSGRASQELARNAAWSRHEAANLLGGELDVHPVRREVVGPGGGAAVCRVELRVQRAVVLQFTARGPNTWGRTSVRRPETTLGNQLLCLAGVSLVLEKMFRPAGAAVKDDALCGVDNLG